MKRIKSYLPFILSITICLLVSSEIFAWRSIEIERLDDDPISIDITDDLQLSFTSTHLVADNRLYSIEIPISDLKGLQTSHIANELTTSVESPETTEDIQFNSTGMKLSVPGDVIVYSLSGILVKSEKGCSEMSFSSFPAGVYIVVVNKLSFKIKI